MKWGTKVKTTELAIKKNIFPKHRRGVYLGRGKGRWSPSCMVVVCKGQITPQCYHSDFWVETS